MFFEVGQSLSCVCGSRSSHFGVSILIDISANLYTSFTLFHKNVSGISAYAVVSVIMLGCLKSFSQLVALLGGCLGALGGV